MRENKNSLPKAWQKLPKENKYPVRVFEWAGEALRLPLCGCFAF